MAVVPLWLIVSAIFIVLLLILFRSMNQIYILSLVKKHFFWFFAIALVVFLAISLVHIHTNYDIDLTSSGGVASAGKIYFGWLKTVFSSAGDVTSYAVKQDWFTPTGVNSTGK